MSEIPTADRFGSRYRDAFKTTGEVRAAAFRVSDILRKTENHAVAAELHDSLCVMLPEESEIPASTVRRAEEMRQALQAAAQRFREYEASHQAKADAAPDNEAAPIQEKADRNREMAEMCEKALGL